MNPQDEIALLEQLINQILNSIQEILQSGEVISDEFQGILAQEIELTTNRIYELRSQNQEQNPVEGLSPSGAEPPLGQGMDSSNVNSFGYDENTGRLLVKFNGKDEKETGPIYGYEGVPKVIFDLFQKGAIPARTDGSNKWGKWWKGKVPSLGASMHTLIKEGGYQYQKLS